MSFFENLFGLTRDLNAENFNLVGAKTISADQEFNNGNSGAAATVQWSIAQYQALTLTANCTLTFGSAPAGVCIVRLRLVQDGTGGRTVTWPAGIQWQQSTVPTLSTGPGAIDFIELYYNGTTYFGSASLTYGTMATPQTHAATATKLIYQGDSITAGVGPTPTIPYPYLASLNFFPGFGPAVANVGVAGATIDDCTTALPTDVYPKITAAHAAGQIVVVSLFAGTNDIANSGHTAAQVETSWTSWVSTVSGHLNAGDIILLWTILPRNVGGFDTVRLTANTWLRSNFAGLSSNTVLLVDVGADPTLGPNSACTNSQLSFDGTHPTLYGYGLLAGYCAPISMLNQSQSTITNLSTNSGSHVGGTSVTITGTRLLGTYEVVIGGVPAATFAINSDTSIVSTTGPVVGGSTGNGPVYVVGPNGGATFASGFTYV
jgi:lysophospholipase L1-like esterase